MVDSGENLGVLPFVPWVLSPFWGPTGSILKTSGLLDPGGSLQLSPLGVPLRTLELLVWIILGAQSNLLNKLMTVWLFVCSQICGSQAQNSKRVFQDSVLNNFLPTGRRWQWQWPVCGARQGCHKRPLQGFCLGERNSSEHSELEQGGAVSQGPSRPSWRPCWDSVLSLLGLQVRLVGPTWWSFEDPRALQPPWAVVRGCFCRVSGQCGAPRWPQISLGSVCSRFTQRWQEHHPPRAGLQVCVPRGGAQCRGWAQAWVARWARRGPQGGADYLLVSQVANAEERVLLPGAVFS